MPTAPPLPTPFYTPAAAHIPLRAPIFKINLLNKCPVSGCKFGYTPSMITKHKGNEDNISDKKISQSLAKHLKSHKPHKINNIEDSFWPTYNLKLCKLCAPEIKIFNTSTSTASYENHIQTSHNNVRTKPIDKIYREHFGTKVDKTKLHESLHYVSKWASQPAPFRNTFYANLSSKQKDLFQDKLLQILEIFLEIHNRPLPDSTNPIEHMTLHILYLFNFLEAIICAPKPSRSTSLNNLFQARIQKLNTSDF